MTAAGHVLAAGATLLLAACAPAGSASPAGPSAAADSLRFQAIQALQDVRGEPLLREDEIREVAAGIAAIRRRFPRVRGIANRWDEAVVQVEVQDSLMAALARRFPARDTLVRETGVPGVDSLNAALGASATRIVWEWGALLEPRFSRPVNAAALAQVYRRAPGVVSALPLQLISGDSYSSIRARMVGDTITYAFVLGWGDCMSGCFAHHGWTFAYDRRTGDVRRTGESGTPLP